MRKKYQVGIVIALVLIIIALGYTYVEPKIANYINYTSSSKQTKLSKTDVIDYWADNIDECKKYMESYGYKCEIVNENENGKEVQYLEIEPDDKIKIKFEINYRSRVIEIISDKEEDHKDKIKIILIGDIPNDAEATVSTSGGISCNYKSANDFNTPEQRGAKDAADLDRKIKNFISTDELNDLREKSYSIYDDLMEKYKEKSNTDTK